MDLNYFQAAAPQHPDFSSVAQATLGAKQREQAAIALLISSNQHRLDRNEQAREADQTNTRQANDDVSRANDRNRDLNLRGREEDRLGRKLTSEQDEDAASRRAGLSVLRSLSGAGAFGDDFQLSPELEHDFSNASPESQTRYMNLMHERAGVMREHRIQGEHQKAAQANVETFDRARDQKILDDETYQNLVATNTSEGPKAASDAYQKHVEKLRADHREQEEKDSGTKQIETRLKEWEKTRTGTEEPEHVKVAKAALEEIKFNVGLKGEKLTEKIGEGLRAAAGDPRLSKEAKAAERSTAGERADKALRAPTLGASFDLAASDVKARIRRQAQDRALEELTALSKSSEAVQVMKPDALGKLIGELTQKHEAQVREEYGWGETPTPGPSAQQANPPAPAAAPATSAAPKPVVEQPPAGAPRNLVPPDIAARQALKAAKAAPPPANAKPVKPEQIDAIVKAALAGRDLAKEPLEGIDPAALSLEDRRKVIEAVTAARKKQAEGSAQTRIRAKRGY